MNKKIVVAVVVIAGLVGLVVYKRMHQEPLAVKTVVVDQGAVEATVSNTKAGTVKACRRSKLSMRGGGIVDKLLVKKGDRVKAGQLLLELWNRDRKTSQEQALQNLLKADEEVRQACGANLQIDNKPAPGGVVSMNREQAACELAKAHRQVADDVRRDVENTPDRTQLRAPFAGVIAEINGEVGEYVTPSPPGVLTPPAVDLIDDSCLYVTAPIDEVDAGQLKLGMPVDVTLDAFRNRHFTAHVTRIAPYVVDLEKQARTVDIDVKLDAPPADIKLLIGYSADTTVILARKESVLRVPTEAILTGNQVWLINANHKLEKREIKTGIGNWSFTEIVSGLQAGDTLVRTPDLVGLEANRLVTIQKEQN